MSVDNSRFSYGRPQWDMDRGELAAASTEVGDQVASKQDLSALLPNYGAVTCSASGSFANAFMPFDTADGEMKGCYLATSKNGITLNAVGMWECKVNARAWSNALVPANSILRLELFDDSDAFVKRREMTVVSAISSGQQVSVFQSFIVPRPGFTVRAYAMSDGGSQWARQEAFMSAQYVYNGTPNFGGA